MMAILLILKSGVSRKMDFEFQSKVHPPTHKTAQMDYKRTISNNSSLTLQALPLIYGNPFQENPYDLASTL